MGCYPLIDDNVLYRIRNRLEYLLGRSLVNGTAEHVLNVVYHAALECDFIKSFIHRHNPPYPHIGGGF